MSDDASPRCRGRRVWDSRGRPTVEAEVILAGGAPAAPSLPRAPRPARARPSTSATAATRFGGYDVTRAVAAVNGEIAAALGGPDALDQDSDRPTA